MLHAVWLLPAIEALKLGVACHQRMAKHVVLHYSGAMDGLCKLCKTVPFLLSPGPGHVVPLFLLCQLV